MIFRRLLPLLAFVAALAVSGCGRYVTAGAAIVNGDAIPQEEVDARVVALQGAEGAQDAGGDQKIELAREVIRQLIEERLLRQEIRRRGIEITSQAVERRIDEIASSPQFGSRERLEEFAKQQGLSPRGLRERVAFILGSEELSAKLAGDDPVSDGEVRRFYRESIAQFQEARVAQIVFQVTDPSAERTALTEARRARARIAGGASFAAVAREVSDDPQSRARGGDLGFQPLRALPPEVAQAVATMRPGQLSQPVRTQAGYYLVRLAAKRTTPLAKLRADIEAQLLSERLEEILAKWRQKALASADIVVNPRYGDWDPKTLQISPHRFYVPGTPSPTQQPFAPPGGQPLAPPGS